MTRGALALLHEERPDVAAGIALPLFDHGPVLLQARGRGIYDYARAYLEAGAVGTEAGRSVLMLDLPYLNDLHVAQTVADALLQDYGMPRTRPESVTLAASRDAATAALAIGVELHELFRVVDEPAGVDSAHHVNRLAWRIGDPDDVRLTVDLSHTDETGVWSLGKGALGETTRLGWG